MSVVSVRKNAIRQTSVRLTDTLSAQHIHGMAGIRWMHDWLLRAEGIGAQDGSVAFERIAVVQCQPFGAPGLVNSGQRVPGEVRLLVVDEVEVVVEKQPAQP